MDSPIPPIVPQPAVRLLLIEDNSDDAYLVQKHLQESPSLAFSMVCVDRLALGIDHLCSSQFDVILVDLSLPDSSGLETFRALHRCASHLPILVLTGCNCDVQSVRAVKDGAQDYLVKDQINADGLTRAISYAVERHRALRKLSDYAEQLRDQNETMRAERELAEQIQHALLPRSESLPPPEGGSGSGAGPRWRVTHRYLPWNGLAGDFFQVFPLEDDRVGVLICDVMGHGVRSALVAALIRGLVKMEDGSLERPGELMTRLNDLLVETLWKRGVELFTTACYMVADPRRGKVTCANAGHPSPIGLSKEHKDVEHLKNGSSGPALGIFEKKVYSDSTFEFDPSDALLLYTDGICEVTGRDDTCFEDRIPERLRHRMGEHLDRLLDGLIADARSFSGSSEFGDDVCLVGLQFS